MRLLHFIFLGVVTGVVPDPMHSSRFAVLRQDDAQALLSGEWFWAMTSRCATVVLSMNNIHTCDPVARDKSEGYIIHIKRVLCRLKIFSRYKHVDNMIVLSPNVRFMIILSPIVSRA